MHEQITVKSTDGTEVNLLPSEDGTGTIAIIFAPTQDLIQRTIMDLADQYPIVQFTRAKFHNGCWHATGVVR